MVGSASFGATMPGFPYCTIQDSDLELQKQQSASCPHFLLVKTTIMLSTMINKISTYKHGACQRLELLIQPCHS